MKRCRRSNSNAVDKAVRVVLKVDKACLRVTDNKAKVTPPES